MLQTGESVIGLIGHVLEILAVVVAALLGVWGFVVNRVRAAIKSQRAACLIEMTREYDNRTAADTAMTTRIEGLESALTNRVENLARDVHNYMGKLDLLAEHLHAVELASVEQVGSLRTEMREGFARLAGLLDRGFNGKTKHHGGDDA